ncbi:hypothetical protein V8C40DRAFT_109423 [Trichoderma camerunense]
MTATRQACCITWAALFSLSFRLFLFFPGCLSLPRIRKVIPVARALVDPSRVLAPFAVLFIAETVSNLPVLMARVMTASDVCRTREPC